MEKFVLEARQLFGIHLTGRQVVALMTFERELLAWNKKYNLTAIRDAEGNPHQALPGLIFLRDGVEGKPAAATG